MRSRKVQRVELHRFVFAARPKSVERVDGHPVARAPSRQSTRSHTQKTTRTTVFFLLARRATRPLHRDRARPSFPSTESVRHTKRHASSIASSRRRVVAVAQRAYLSTGTLNVVCVIGAMIDRCVSQTEVLCVSSSVRSRARVDKCRSIPSIASVCIAPVDGWVKTHPADQGARRDDVSCPDRDDDRDRRVFYHR